MADMLVRLYPLPTAPGLEEALRDKGVTIKKSLAPDMSRIIAFAEENGHPGWADEIRVCFTNQPVSCYIAVKHKELIGFGCYETTARGFFGPMLVKDTERRQGVGKALLLSCLAALRELGYAYAFIGWPAEDAIHFYQEATGGMMLPDDGHGVYSRLIALDS